MMRMKRMMRMMRMVRMVRIKKEFGVWSKSFKESGEIEIENEIN